MRFRPALLGLCLAGCSGTDPAQVATPAEGCRVERVAALPMASGTAYVVVPAEINGQAASMVVDTGDERLTVTPEAEQRLHLGEDRRRRTTVHGLGGTVTNYDASLDSLELGGANLFQTDAAVSELPMVLPVEPRLAGILGADTLSDYEVELDYAARQLRLWERNGCDRVAPAWSGAYATARLTRGMGSLMTLEVLVDGTPVRALLDTGATHTAIDFAAARQIGIGGAALSAAHVGTARGADGSDMIVRLSRGHELAVGGVRQPGMALAVGAVQVPFADMLLGADFLRGRDLWISYANQVAFIR